MAEKVRDVMTPEPTSMQATTSILEAARAMKNNDIGAVIVLDENNIGGIVTDRDIVVRAVAEGKEPSRAVLGDILSREVTTLSPDDSVEKAVSLMKDRAVRRLPVVDNGRPVGIVSIGDLAVERDPESALGNISAAPPNR